jgi:hypothetical protein
MGAVDDYSNLASLLANTATFLGIPLGLYVLWRDRVKDRRDRELAIYSQVYVAYGDYLKLCLERPQLTTVETTRSSTGSRDARSQQLFLCMVVNMLEAAYFLYRDADSEFRRSQWTGWNDYMRMWAQNKELLADWDEIVIGFDSDFVEHLTKLREGEDAGALASTGRTLRTTTRVTQVALFLDAALHALLGFAFALGIGPLGAVDPEVAPHVAATGLVGSAILVFVASRLEREPRLIAIAVALVSLHLVVSLSGLAASGALHHLVPTIVEAGLLIVYAAFAGVWWRFRRGPA